MHCDVVIRLRPGVVEAIGGNVDDMVVLRRLPVDRQGRVLPAPPDKPVFLLVLSPNEGAGAAPPTAASGAPAGPDRQPGAEGV